jgi:hypothetical protein
MVQLPELAQSQVVMFYPALADAFFGSDAFIEECNFLKEDVRRFMDHVMANAWNRARKTITRQRKSIGNMRKNANALFDGKS